MSTPDFEANAPLRPIYPRLRKATFLFHMPDGAMQIRSPEGIYYRVTSGGSQIRKVTALLNGTMSAEEIGRELGDTISHKQLYKILDKLSSINLVAEGDATVASELPAQVATLDQSDVTFSQDIQKRLSESTVLVVGENSISNRVHQLLSTAGVRSIPYVSLHLDDKFAALVDQADIVIVCCTVYRRTLVHTINRLCFEKNTPWIGTYEDAQKAYVGPFVIPAETACGRCTELRILAAHPFYEETVAYWDAIDQLPEEQAPHSLTDPETAGASSLLVKDVIHYLTGQGDVQSIAAQISIDPKNMALRKHPVLKVPLCPICSGNA